MGHKRQRQRVSAAARTLSLSLAVLALAWTNSEAAASGGVSSDPASVVGREYSSMWNQQHRFRVLQENEAGVVDADAENREGSASDAPTAAPVTPAPEPTTAVPVTVTPAPSETPATTTPAPATTAPTAAPTPAPTPSTVAPTVAPVTETPAPTSSAPAPSTADTPAPTTQTPAPTTQTPAPSAESAAPTTQTPAPTTAAPTTAPPPVTTAPTAAPTAAPAPPATTTAPTTAPPPPTAAPSPPATTAPVTAAPTQAPAPAPVPTTAAPTTKPPTAAPPATTVTPSPTPSVTPAPKPTVTTKAPTPSTTPSTGGAAGSGSGSKTPEPSTTPEASGNGKVIAPDLNDLPPIAGSGVISKSNRSSNDGSSDSASNKTRSSDSDASKMSTLAIAGIILGVVGSVIVAVFFVHARRRRNHEKEFDSARQRQLDAFFAPVGAPPIPTSGHPGAASISSSNGMTIAAAPASLTPRGHIPIASSHRFKRGASGAGPGSKGRFTDRVMSEGSIAFKGRMDSIPQSPHRQSSDFGDSEYDNDSFLGGKAYSSDRPPSDRSGYSVRTSSNGTANGDGYPSGPRSTGTSYARGSNDSKPLYFPAGMPQPRSSMVEMGLATTGPVPTVRASLSDEFFDSLPRGTSGDILVPLAKHDDAYTEYSVSSDEYGSPYDSRLTRGDSNVSSSSNPNPWAMTGSEANLSARDFSVVSSAMSSDLPTSGRSDDSYYQSDGYDSDSQRSGRSDSYGYADPRSTGEMSNRSFLSFSSDGRATGVATTPDRFSLEVEEGNI